MDFLSGRGLTKHSESNIKKAETKLRGDLLKNEQSQKTTSAKDYIGPFFFQKDTFCYFQDLYIGF